MATNEDFSDIPVWKQVDTAVWTDDQLDTKLKYQEAHLATLEQEVKDQQHYVNYLRAVQRERSN